MRKRIVFLSVLALFALLFAGAKADLIGCRTHAGEINENGWLRLYGCNEHGERLPDGERVLDAAVRDHMTVVLRDDGTVSVYGRHDFDKAEIAALSRVTDICLTENCLLALTASGSVAAVVERNRAEEMSGNEKEYLAALGERQDIVRLAPGAAFLKDGCLMMDSYGRTGAFYHVLPVGEDWENYPRAQVIQTYVSGSMKMRVLALRYDGTLFLFDEAGRGTALLENVLVFDAGEFGAAFLIEGRQLMVCSTFDLTGLNPAEGLVRIRNAYAEELAGVFYNDLAVWRDGGSLRWDTGADSAGTLPAWWAARELEGYRDVDAVGRDGKNLILKYDDGCLDVVSLDSDGNAFYFCSRFNDPFRKEKIRAFIASGGPERQAEERDANARLSWPYAVGDNGGVFGLKEGCAAQVLAWQGVKGISAWGSGESELTAAVTRDGRVLTYCGGGDPDAAAAAAEAAGWTGITQVTAYGRCIAAVDADGYVRVAGSADNAAEARTWQDVAQVAATGGIYTGDWYGVTHIVALCADGTVKGDLEGVTGVVHLSGCNRELYATRLDGTVEAGGWNLLGDCAVYGLRGIRCACVNDEFYSMPAFLTVDGRAYRGIDNVLYTPMPGLDRGGAVALAPADPEETEMWMALYPDGTIAFSDGYDVDMSDLVNQIVEIINGP